MRNTLQNLKRSVVGMLLLPLAGLGYADAIASAQYVDSVERYGHFALGKPHEYATVSAKTTSGRVLRFDLPADLVFEDLVPRLVRLTAGSEPLLLTIVSGADGGAQLMVLQKENDKLVLAAQSAPIGTPMRWLNPVGMADLDGDGTAEVAAVITPHIGGTLKVYRKEGNRSFAVAFPNHGPVWEVGTVRTLEGWQRRGLGKKVVDAAVLSILSKGHRVRYHVESTNQASRALARLRLLACPTPSTPNP